MRQGCFVYTGCFIVSGRYQLDSFKLYVVVYYCVFECHVNEDLFLTIHVICFAPFWSNIISKRHSVVNKNGLIFWLWIWKNANILYRVLKKIGWVSPRQNDVPCTSESKLMIWQLCKFCLNDFLKFYTVCALSAGFFCT